MQNSPARAGVDVGTVIAGTYTVEALIGRGGMGAVFLASHNRLPGKKVAIKMIHAELAGEEVLARFKREAQIASLLGHPNIVGVENFDVLPDGTPYLVLEYLQGETLAQRLRGGPLAVEPAMSIVRQIGSALAAAHRAGVVHRDLKPQNVFLVPTEFDGRTVEVAKVLDFGISKMRGSQTVKTQDTALLGTPQYMAPEQATGQHAAVDERTDIFALGAMVYEMLSGHPAFEGASIPEVVFKVVYEQPVPLEQRVAGLPPAIAAAVHRALAKPQAERFGSVGELVEALTGQPLPPPRTTAAPPADTGAGSPSTGPKRTNEAFAQTVGSGDHGAEVAVRPVATPVAPSQARPPDATALASTTAAPPVTAAPPPRRSRAGLVAGIAIACAALGAGGVYLAMRGGGRHARHDRAGEHLGAEPVPVAREIEVAPPHEAAPPAHEAAPPAHEAAPPAHEAAPPAHEAVPPAHEATPPRHERAHPATDEAADQEPAGNDGTADKIPQAEHALADHDFLHARMFANSALEVPTISRGHRLEAYAILGIAACAGNHDDEGALIQLQRIHAPRVRRRVIDACHKAGQLAGTQ